MGERSFDWEDPMITARAARRMAGLDFLQAIVAGELPPPPIARALGFRVEEIDRGRAVFAVEPAEYHYNPIGVVHGGLAATLFDSALGCAVQTMLPAGTGYTTVELHVTFLRPLTAETGEVLCRAEVVHVGRRLATAEARLEDREGRLYGTASTVCLILGEDPPSG